MEIKKIVSLLKTDNFTLRDNKIYFITPPKDYIPDNEKDETFYSNRGRWSKTRRIDFDYYRKNLSNRDSSQILLDLGCGTGLFRDVTSPFDYIGVDIYPYKNVQMVADITKTLPLKDNSVDIVLLSNVLEHTPDPWILLHESYRVLKPNGFILGSVPFLANVHGDPYDFLRYTNYMLEHMFKLAGFKNFKLISLQLPVDLYEWMQGKFFAMLYKTKLTKTQKFLAKIAHKINRILFNIFLPLYRKVKPDLATAKRYGFQAIK